MSRIRRSLARLTGLRASQLRAGRLTGPPARRPGRSGRDGFAGRFTLDMAVAANVAAGHQLGQRGRGTRPAGRAHPAAPATAPGLRPPRTIQLCIHCRQRPAGFWVSLRGGQTVRRPWCLSCCQELDHDRCDVIPFAG